MMVFYFINFTVFVYILSCSATWNNFWCMYGSNAAVHIMNNRNVPGDADTNSEITPLW